MLCVYVCMYALMYVCIQYYVYVCLHVFMYARITTQGARHVG